ncbi:MAG: hemolysin [Halobacteriovorax sp.]|nr:hemolysin [Halobacteriovorax sp.]
MLFFYISLSILVSFICSMLEAIILSVTPSYLTSLEKTNPSLFNKVKHLKKDIEKPLASILTFNTIAHTIGAAGAGAEAQRVYGNEALTIFSILLTFGILFFSEIIPKSLGASYWKTFLPLASAILSPMIVLSYPIVWLSEKVSSLVKGKKVPISREEIEAIADIGLNEGAIAQSEYNALKGLMRFKEVLLKDIVTQRDKVEGLNFDLTIEEAYEQAGENSYTRLVIFGVDIHDVRGYIMKDKLQHAYIKDKSQKLITILKPLLILPHDTELPTLLRRLLNRREHISAIVNDAGEFIGIVTLEDLIENMLGLEIYDEGDLEGKKEGQ